MLERCLLFLLFLLVYYNILRAEIATERSCIPIRDCPDVYEFTKQSTDAEAIFQLLKSVHCDVDDEQQPKVWCQLQKTTQNCTTIHGSHGICLPKQNCYMNIASEWITNSNSKENECGEDNTHICCPLDKQNQPQYVSVLPLPGECGYHPDSKKIFGGTEAELDEFSWMGILQYRRNAELKQACSGSLINREYLITAAHCVDPSAVKDMGYDKLESVVLGEYNTETETDCIEYDEGITDCADEPKVFPIKTVELHPQWDYHSGNKENDIALLRLDRPVDYTDFIKPVCLPFEGWTPTDSDHLFIAGWGKSPTERRTAIKMKAVVHHRKCIYNENVLTQICAGGEGTDICSGDSGGPLMLGKFVNKRYYMFLGGIASFGVRRCGIAPSVYTFVPNYIHWIQSVVEK